LRMLIALHFPREDHRDVTRSIHVPVEGPMADTLAVLGPPIKTVLRILVLAVVADLGRAVLVHDDNALVR